MKAQKVNITGGTFALCFWLLLIVLALVGIEDELSRLNRRLQASLKVELVDPNSR